MRLLQTLKIQILLDTNFFMIPYKNHIDVFSEIERIMSSNPSYELATLESVRKELISLKEKSKGEDRIAAEVGLSLLENRHVKILGDEGTRWADGELIKISQENRGATMICTNDKHLRKTLIKQGIPVISMRGKDHLAFV